MKSMAERMDEALKFIKTASPEKRVDILIKAGLVEEKDREKLLEKMKNSIWSKVPKDGSKNVDFYLKQDLENKK